MVGLCFKAPVSSLLYIFNPLTMYTQQVSTHNKLRVISKVEKLKVFADSDTGSGAPIDRYSRTECGQTSFSAQQKALELDY